MDKDCWMQGFFLVPIKKDLNYYVDDYADGDGDPDCHPENKDGADYWWESIIESVDGAPTEGDNPSWKSYMSKKLREPNLRLKKEQKKTIKARFTTGESDATDPEKTSRWGSQRTMSKVLTELTANNIRGVFIITLCRPDDTDESTHYDEDAPRTLVTDESLLTNSDLEKIKRIEKLQKEKNVEYHEIYNDRKSEEAREELNSIKQKPDAVFLEYLPHYESDVSVARYKKNIADMLYNRELSEDGDDEIEDWLDEILDIKLKGRVAPLHKPMRVSESITGSILSGSDTRHSRLLKNLRSDEDTVTAAKALTRELSRQKEYKRHIYSRWEEVVVRVNTMDKLKLPEIRKQAKAQYRALSIDGQNKPKRRLIIEMVLAHPRSGGEVIYQPISG
tara:strand:- start:540 stop:1712 length:1173 start_codon:yes stop_codon:yes gene_type:complete